VRMVRTLRAESGTEKGTVQRVARQLGYGVESVRTWVRQADIDEGLAPGLTTVESKTVQEVEQENRELKLANEILIRATSFFGAELDRQHKNQAEHTQAQFVTYSSCSGPGPCRHQPPPAGMRPSFLTSTWTSDPGVRCS